MSALRTILIADDLTGSLDSIAPFAALGARCVSAVSADAVAGAMALSPEVLSVNLGTREAAPQTARDLATKTTRVLMQAAAPGTLWLKKIDSRLKGPIAAEIAGMAEVLHPARVLLCPAIPELGRIVSQGHLQGHGIPRNLPVAATVAVELPGDVAFEAPDATSDADLDRLAASVTPGCLVAAARGLASALARRLYPGREPGPARIPTGPIGFAIGSRDTVTLAQLAQLLGHGGPLLTPAPDGEVPALSSPGSFVIQATAGAGASGTVVAVRLAEGVLRHAPAVKTLVLTGGETAAALLGAAGIGLLKVEGEILPGLPVCRAIDAAGLPVLITKSGGFGPPDTLLRLWQAAQTAEGCRSP
jgi:uncharacterized protein YgbK (DUF1537 family)